MLIVIEGQSAVGKTTFAQAFPAEQVVGEERVEMPPHLSEREAYPYLIKSNTRRWRHLLDNVLPKQRKRTMKVSNSYALARSIGSTQNGMFIASVRVSSKTCQYIR
jgi:hypothetical protein